MANVDPLRGRVLNKHTIPYGTFTKGGEDVEVKSAYYGYGYRRDEDMPPLPQVELDEEVVDPEEALFKKELHNYIEDLLDGLTRREARVLRMRFGIGTNHDMTLDEIAQAIDVSRERVRQIEAKALRKLNHPDRGLYEIAKPEDFAHRELQRSKHLRMRMYDIEMMHQGVAWFQRQLNNGIIPTKPDNVLSWIEHIRQTDNLLYNHIHDQVTEHLNRLRLPHDDGGA